MCGMFSQEPFGSRGGFGVARVVSEVVLRGLTMVGKSSLRLCPYWVCLRQGEQEGSGQDSRNVGQAALAL